MADVVNIPSLIFQILKISPQLVSKYHGFQDQLLNLIFIPHIILILFLMAFSGMLISRILKTPHMGMRILIGIAAYLYIVWAGWYGTWLLPLVNTYFQVALIVAIIFFGISIFWHPASHEATLKLIQAGAEEVGKRTIGKAKEREKFEKELKSVRDSIKKAQSQMQVLNSQGMAGSYQSAALQQQIQQYEEMERQLKRAIEESE